MDALELRIAKAHAESVLSRAEEMKKLKPGSFEWTLAAAAQAAYAEALAISVLRINP